MPEQTATKTLVDRVMDMETTGGEHNWEKLKSFFTEDVVFKVGAGELQRGSQAVVDYLRWLYTTQAKPQMPHDFRAIWELGDTVVLEMDANYIRLKDNKPIQFPCVDILRFRGNLIQEWRVYPDQAQLHDA
jgi:ketosteroid isomerase-like protein